MITPFQRPMICRMKSTRSCEGIRKTSPKRTRSYRHCSLRNLTQRRWHQMKISRKFSRILAWNKCTQSRGLWWLWSRALDGSLSSQHVSWRLWLIATQYFANFCSLLNESTHYYTHLVFPAQFPLTCRLVLENKYFKEKFAFWDNIQKSRFEAIGVALKTIHYFGLYVDDHICARF